TISQQRSQLPRITLGDVLLVVHHSLRKRIAPSDWAMLTPKDAEGVTNTFTRRCREKARRSEMAVRNDGVKRVDFLMGKTVLKGLLRAPGNPDGCVRSVETRST
ncbi:hypothetical protein C8R43DRAFT_907877, partial [Mycena crocata]